MYDFKISKDGKTLESCNTFGWYDSEGIVITVPNGIEVIGRYCFYQNNVNDCWMIKEIVLPNSIKKIEEKAFSHNYKLISLRMLKVLALMHLKNAALYRVLYCHKQFRYLKMGYSVDAH